MKAWRFGELGEPSEVMRLDEVPEPQPAADQVLVRVRATPVNFADALVMRGTYQTTASLPAVPGMEVCGDVVEVGSRVSHDIAVGDRVIGTPSGSHGAYAEYTIIDQSDVMPAPRELDDAESAAMLIAYQTSWFGLHRRALIRTGETLLVHAAAGGVGSAAVQLGKAAGATVIGVVGGAEKAERAREAGCEVVIDRYVDDVVAAVKESTRGRGADVVYDPVGGEAFALSTKCIAWEGRIVVVGFASGTMARARTEHIMVKNYSVLGLHWGSYRTFEPAAVRRAHEELCTLVRSGRVRPIVSRRDSFMATPQAIMDVARGKTVGRVVVMGSGLTP